MQICIQMLSFYTFIRLLRVGRRCTLPLACSLILSVFLPIQLFSLMIHQIAFKIWIPNKLLLLALQSRRLQNHYWWLLLLQDSFLPPKRANTSCKSNFNLDLLLYIILVLMEDVFPLSCHRIPVECAACQYGLCRESSSQGKKNLLQACAHWQSLRFNGSTRPWVRGGHPEKPQPQVTKRTQPSEKKTQLVLLCCFSFELTHTDTHLQQQFTMSGSNILHSDREYSNKYKPFPQ